MKYKRAYIVAPDAGRMAPKWLSVRVDNNIVSLTIHLQNHYDRPFDRIRVGNKAYGVDFSRKLRTKQVYVVSEVV